jgi:exodeoxyribonuclease V alpha subunit
LPADIVVIDEASMVDLAMLRAVLEALREDCVLVLVGDAEQLASVGTGSVLLDLVGAMESAGAQDLVRLDHSFRADTTLVPINEAVRRGSLENFRQAWRDAGTARAQWLIVGDQQHLRTRLLAWAARVDAALRAAGAFDTLDGADLRAILGVLRALRQQQLLCALRETGFGAEHVNGVLEDMLRNSNGGASDGDERWYPGRAVMITRNDPPTGLFNGDVGITLRTRNARGEDSLQVWFEASPGAASAGAALPGLRSFNPASLPASEGAFALTVHKSQGSEYQHVAVLLPPDANNPLLSRQMLYTALSRAKASVELWSAEASLEKAVGTIAARSSRLGERLRESADTGQRVANRSPPIPRGA